MYQIKYIFWDFRGTVTKLDPKKNGYVSRLSKIYPTIPKEDIHAALGEGDPIGKYRRGDISESTFWKLFSKNINSPIHKECAKIFHTPIETYANQYKSVINFIYKLKKIGYKNIILSDDYQPQVKNIKKIGRYKPFDSIVVSCDIGLSKRDDITNNTTKIFAYVLKKYKINPKECIFIDDKQANCIAAEKTGIQSIVFQSPRQAIREVKKTLNTK